MMLVIVSTIFVLEDSSNGRIVFLKKIRFSFNNFVSKDVFRFRSVRIFSKTGVVRLMLYYVIHTILRNILILINNLKKGIEVLLLRNKQVVKKIRSNVEKTHLDKISDHKQEVALTQEQKIKLRSID